MPPSALRRLPHALILACLFSLSAAFATVFTQVQGVVHDPQHRPIPHAHITLNAAHSAFTQSAETSTDGTFTLPSIPLGDYTVTVTHDGFATLRQPVELASGSNPVLHFELQVGSVSTTVDVTAEPSSPAGEVTPSTLVDRLQIAETPGADRTNSLAAITDFVPGAYVTHDQLHIRGGHQVSWLIDGVEIPNTNISANLGAQIDPKDIDYLEVQRGSYAAGLGDRTYGMFNVVPRTVFERNRQGELVLSAGSFLQTNDQLNLGDHTERLAWYASLNGNRSDFGLAPPTSRVLHDAANGTGGFASFLYNHDPQDQLRLVLQLRRDFFQIPYDPDPNSFENQQYDSSGLRDSQHERDSLATFSWIHTFSHATVLQVSPFFHGNSADYDPNPNDTPSATTSHRTSYYYGLQTSATTEFAHNTLDVGIYTFGQHDSDLFGANFTDNSAPNFSLTDTATGGVVEEYISDDYKPTSFLTLIAGLRLTQFRLSSAQAGFTEEVATPRFGASLRIPRLNWVLRGFYGRFYQPPPLLTASGPLLTYAEASNTAFAPLHGERDEEHQFAIQIPLRGWLLDVDTFKTRANNFLDHTNLGESGLFFPVTIDGALVRAWEVTLKTPQIRHVGQGHLAYSNQIAEQRGAITGGLICASDCDTDMSYGPLDHDQRNTLNVGFTAEFPRAITASTNVYYGSGFLNGNPDPATPYPNPYLPAHTSVDLSVARPFGENISASITAINVANRRVLLDNSLTFGGFHYNDPRQIFAELRYRFRF